MSAEPEIHPTMKALLEANRKQTALREAFNAAANSVLNNTMTSKQVKKSLETAKEDYVKSLFHLHQVMNEVTFGIRATEDQS